MDLGDLSCYSYWLDSWASISGKGKRFFSPPQGPGRLWDPPNLLSNGYRSLFPEDKATGA
jgi:hypothetical protein